MNWSGSRATGCGIISWSLLLLAGCPSGSAPPVPTPQSPAAQSPAAQSPAAEAPSKQDSPRGASVALPFPPPSGVTVPQFVDIAATAGVDFQRFDDIRGLHRIVESNGGGVAMLDFDGDGWLDLFYTDGCALPVVADESDEQRSNQLFRNHGGDAFDNSTGPAGLAWHGYAHGCAVGDYDNDGFDDLYVTAFGRNCLYRNNGDGTFSDVTEATGTAVAVWSSSAAFADLDRDGNLDLYVVNYVQEDQRSPKLCQDPASPDGYVTCPPTVYRAEDDVCFVADGRGGFVDQTRSAGLTGVDGKGLGVVVFDANLDGWADIYVANDGMPNFLYVNRSGQAAGPASSGSRVELLFEERAAFQGCAVNAEGKAESSMGVACGDMDGDGRSDLFVTHFESETNTLYRNEGEWFEDVTRETGVGPASRQCLGFGAEFLDADNDGWLDLFVANGHIDDMSWGVGKPPYRMPPQFFMNRGQGSFADVSRWSGDYFAQGRWLGRGAAAGDLDRDGDVDLAVSHQLDRSAVLRNDTAAGNSVIVQLIGAPSNRSAIGSRAAVSGEELEIVREVIGGGSYQASSDRRLHFGIGNRDRIEKLRVEWPSGAIREWEEVPAGHYLAIESTGQLLKAEPP